VRVGRVPLVKELLGLYRLVIVGTELVRRDGCRRARLDVWVRHRRDTPSRCGRCGQRSPLYDRGGRDGFQRRWRHVDAGYATVDLIGDTPRVTCASHGVTVAAVAWARHGSWFTRAFEDLVVHDAITGNKNAAAKRYGISWEAVNNACVRVAEEALGRVDLLGGLVAVAIDEVKYKKGQKYLTVVCDHFTGKVVWAANGRSKAVVNEFFDALGPERSAGLRFVSADGAEWIRAVVAARAPDAIVCIDTFHVVGWATEALDAVRRAEWNRMRDEGRTNTAKEFKGLRWVLLRNWENLSGRQRGLIRQLEGANRRMYRAWQLKEELRDIFTMTLSNARRALDDWLLYARRSRLPPFVRLAATIAHYRVSIEATIEWKLTNGIAESNNAAIGRIRSAARGFHSAKAFITMIMLSRAGIAPTLPWSP
jgi:transposase